MLLAAPPHLTPQRLLRADHERRPRSRGRRQPSGPGTSTNPGGGTARRDRNLPSSLTVTHPAPGAHSSPNLPDRPDVRVSGGRAGIASSVRGLVRRCRGLGTRRAFRARGNRRCHHRASTTLRPRSRESRRCSIRRLRIRAGARRAPRSRRSGAAAAAPQECLPSRHTGRAARAARLERGAVGNRYRAHRWTRDVFCRARAARPSLDLHQTGSRPRHRPPRRRVAAERVVSSSARHPHAIDRRRCPRNADPGAGLGAAPRAAILDRTDFVVEGPDRSAAAGRAGQSASHQANAHDAGAATCRRSCWLFSRSLSIVSFPPLLRWRESLSTPGIISPMQSAAVIALLAAGRGCSCGSRPPPRWTDQIFHTAALGGPCGCCLRTPVDFLFTMALLAAMLVFAFDLTERLRRRVRHRRPPPPRTRHEWVVFAITQLGAGALVALLLVGYEVLLGNAISATSVDALHFSLHPLVSARLAFAVGLDPRAGGGLLGRDPRGHRHVGCLWRIPARSGAAPGGIRHCRLFPFWSSRFSRARSAPRHRRSPLCRRHSPASPASRWRGRWRGPVRGIAMRHRRCGCSPAHWSS